MNSKGTIPERLPAAAATAYETTVLTACREVADGLAAGAALRDRQLAGLDGRRRRNEHSRSRGNVTPAASPVIWT